MDMTLPPFEGQVNEDAGAFSSAEEPGACKATKSEPPAEEVRAVCAEGVDGRRPSEQGSPGAAAGQDKGTTEAGGKQGFESQGTRTPCVFPSLPVPAAGLQHHQAPRLLRVTPQPVPVLRANCNVTQRRPIHSFLLLPLNQASQAPVPYWTPQRLLQETDLLRQQNQKLRNRLGVFQQVFRDPQQLKSVLRKLGIQTQ